MKIAGYFIQHLPLRDTTTERLQRTMPPPRLSPILVGLNPISFVLMQSNAIPSPTRIGSIIFAPVHAAQSNHHATTHLQGIPHQPKTHKRVKRKSNTLTMQPLYIFGARLWIKCIRDKGYLCAEFMREST